MSKTDWAESAVLDWLLGGGTPTRPTARYLSLHTADPGEGGSAAELSAGGYARQAISFAPAATGSTSNTSVHTFTASGASWGTISHFAVWDASAGGNCLYKGALVTPRSIADGESATVAAGAISITED